MLEHSKIHHDLSLHYSEYTRVHFSRMKVGITALQE